MALNDPYALGSGSTVSPGTSADIQTPLLTLGPRGGVVPNMLRSSWRQLTLWQNLLFDLIGLIYGIVVMALLFSCASLPFFQPAYVGPPAGWEFGRLFIAPALSLFMLYFTYKITMYRLKFMALVLAVYAICLIIFKFFCIGYQVADWVNWQTTLWSANVKCYTIVGGVPIIDPTRLGSGAGPWFLAEFWLLVLSIVGDIVLILYSTWYQYSGLDMNQLTTSYSYVQYSIVDQTKAAEIDRRIQVLAIIGDVFDFVIYACATVLAVIQFLLFYYQSASAWTSAYWYLIYGPSFLLALLPVVEGIGHGYGWPLIFIAVGTGIYGLFLLALLTAWGAWIWVWHNQCADLPFCAQWDTYLPNADCTTTLGTLLDSSPNSYFLVWFSMIIIIIACMVVVWVLTMFRHFYAWRYIQGVHESTIKHD